MLRVRVCSTHMGGFLGPKVPKQGSLFGRFSLNMGGFAKIRRKYLKWVVFRRNSTYEWVQRYVLETRRGHLSENQAEDLCPSKSHVPPSRGGSRPKLKGGE